MAKVDPNVKSIEKIIKKGYVRHDKIQPELEKANLTNVNPDNVSELVKKYKYGSSWWTRGKIGRGIKTIVDKIGSYLSAVIVAALAAEFIAAREFANSLVDEQLSGFGDNLLFWMGMKKIQLSVVDMAKAMEAVGRATPEIIRALIIGLIAGYVCWKVITRVIGSSMKRSKRRKDINQLLTAPNRANANNMV
ncbi:hypothetical protein GF312_06000 [Candidatus Poribacteria bacterium]|nr:hypothetical protein [Candidatus Poribacteria bacterium]